MKRLDAMVETLRRDGTLRVFNARYRAGRAAAAAEGKGFMSFGVAMARFKKALIPMLQSGKPISGVFEDVLGKKGIRSLVRADCGINGSDDTLSAPL